jgi:7-cyano-7-deazaguanine synthase
MNSEELGGKSKEVSVGSQASGAPMSSVLLLSGGIESSTLLHDQGGEDLRAVFIDYGQRAARQERRAVTVQCVRVHAHLTILDMAAVGGAFRAGQTQKWHVPLPHRNLVALSLGLSYAAQVAASRLYLAVNREDTLAYASASRPFLERFQRLAQTLGDIELATPYIGLTKADVIRRGRALGIDYALTYSCLLGRARHCGRCPQCLKRRAAFADAGMAERTRFYRGP